MTGEVTAIDIPEAFERHKSESLWSLARRKFMRDRYGMVTLTFVGLYFVVAVLVWLGILGQGWDALTDSLWGETSSVHWFGTNQNGQDIFTRAIFSTKTAFEVGIMVSVCAVFVGAIAGAISGFFSGTWIDEIVVWLYGCIDSIPFYLFVAAVAFALKDNPYAMHVAMIATFWTSTGRLIRAEFIKLKHQEFVEAARAIGVSRFKIIFKHILPNTSHLILIDMSIIFIEAIKSEVVLSFLGLGVKNGVSWGLMISESTTEVLAGRFNNFAAASVFMFVLVISFNMFADSLQDALDPKKV